MCDTILISKKLTEHRQNLLAKNSDRPLGECQPLGLFPAGTKREAPAEGSSAAPYLKQPDPDLFDGTGLGPGGSRYAVLGSRPYWLYGFEMGANEKGLFIGNEAEGSRCDAETEEGILGMDLLRYALERCAEAREAVSYLAGLLKTYGQNANASRLFDRRYENTFLLADRKELWVMETAGREWAAKKIPYFAAVSNCYTIGTEWDLCSENMESLVRERRWLHPEEPVDFAKAYTKPAARQRASVPRRMRMIRLFLSALLNSLPEQERKQVTEQKNDTALLRLFQQLGARLSMNRLPAIFTDHFENEVNAPRFSLLGGENCSVCMHANTWDESQTAASMFMTYDPALGPEFRWAPASPCMSLWIPVFWVSTEQGHSSGPKLPESMSLGGEFYDEASLWWRLERLVSLVSIDEQTYSRPVREQLAGLSRTLSEKSPELRKEAAGLLRGGNAEAAQAVLDRLTALAADALGELALETAEQISLEIRETGGLYGPRKEFLEEYAGRVRMPLL